MKKSYLIAVSMSLIIIIWMASGLLVSSSKGTDTQSVNEDKQQLLVETDRQNAQMIQLNLTVQGQVEPFRETAIRSDIDGRVIDILIKEGTWVSAGDILFRLDPEDRKIKLAQEQALLLSRKNTYERNLTLVKQNLQPKSALEDAFAALKTAEANVERITLEMSKLNITAPFDGVIDRLFIEANSYVKSNSDIAQFVDNSKLVVVVPVAQQDFSKLSKQLSASVKFATGEIKTGSIQFISSLADKNTRTFRVEVVVENDTLTIPAGISAEVDIPVEQALGHFVSPAILSLDASGQIGIKFVNEQNIVVFAPITIIKATTNGVWVKGLPNDANIITIGQGFVEAGVAVDWSPATNITSASL